MLWLFLNFDIILVRFLYILNPIAYMPQEAKYVNNEFTVKESATTNLLIGLFFLILFLFVLTNFLSDTRAYDDNKRHNLYAIISMTLLPAIIFLIKSYFHPTIIIVNKNGFYYLGTLKTNWTNFISAEV